MSTVDETAKYAYETVLRGLNKPRDAKDFMPSWDAAQTWVRDAMRVAILTGALRHKILGEKDGWYHCSNCHQSHDETVEYETRDGLRFCKNSRRLKPGSLVTFIE